MSADKIIEQLRVERQHEIDLRVLGEELITVGVTPAMASALRSDLLASDRRCHRDDEGAWRAAQPVTIDDGTGYDWLTTRQGEPAQWFDGPRLHREHIVEACTIAAPALIEFEVQAARRDDESRFDDHLNAIRTRATTLAPRLEETCDEPFLVDELRAIPELAGFRVDVIDDSLEHKEELV